MPESGNRAQRTAPHFNPSPVVITAVLTAVITLVLTVVISIMHVYIRSAVCYGSKGNDLKPFFGSLFQAELAKYSHWGWSDLDCIFGDMKSALTDDVLSQFDVITFPDGVLDALYTAGQLTLFRNIEYFRKIFQIETQHSMQEDEKDVYGMSWGNLISQSGNRIWDEKFAIHFAVRHPNVTVLFDFRRQAAQGIAEVIWHRGRLRRAAREELDSCSGRHNLRMSKRLEMLKEKDCVPYWHEWVWMCASTCGAVYTWRRGTLCWQSSLKLHPPEDWTPAFFHIFSWKGAPNWDIHPEGHTAARWRLSKTEQDFKIGPDSLKDV